MSNKRKKKRWLGIGEVPFIKFFDKTFYLERGAPLIPSTFFQWLTNSKTARIALLSMFILAIVLHFFDGIYIVGSVILWLMFVALLIEAYRSSKKMVNYYDDSIKRGGKIIDPWNSTFFNASIRRASLIVAIVSIVLYTLFFGYCILDESVDSREIFNIVFLPCIFYFFLFANLGILMLDRFPGYKMSFFRLSFLVYMSFYVYAISGFSVGPIIFFDYDEGVLLGGAVFPYAAFSGICSYNRYDNSFKIRSDGKLIAVGRMLPADMDYLCTMIEVRGKYTDYMAGDDLPASSLADESTL